MKRWMVTGATALATAAWGISVPQARAESKPTGGQAAPSRPYAGPKKRLAVADMDVEAAVRSARYGSRSSTSYSITSPTEFGRGMTEMLTTSLLKTDRFLLVERKNLNDIQDEQALAASGAVAPDTAPARGSLLGAQVIVRGAVTEVAYDRKGIGGDIVLPNGIRVKANQDHAFVALDIRLYDTTSGQILDSVRTEGRAQATGAGIDYSRRDFRIGTVAFNNSPLGRATRQAVDRAVTAITEKMANRPWEGRIAELDGTEAAGRTLYINAGSRAGIRAGDELVVMRPGRPVIDPETKAVIGRTRDAVVGRCRVESVTDEMAEARPLTGTGFEKGDLVRFPENATAPAG